MSDEDGHQFIENGCCWNCGMQMRYYLEIKAASREQPERQDLKDRAKCFAQTVANEETVKK